MDHRLATSSCARLNTGELVVEHEGLQAPWNTRLHFQALRLAAIAAQTTRAAPHAHLTPGEKRPPHGLALSLQISQIGVDWVPDARGHKLADSAAAIIESHVILALIPGAETNHKGRRD